MKTRMLSLTSVAAYVLVIRPSLQRWGTTIVERYAPMPGDDPSGQAKTKATRAVTVNAPSKDVWAQLLDVNGFVWEPTVGTMLPGRLAGMGFTVAEVEPEKNLVLIRGGADHALTRSAALHALSDERTRLVIRTSAWTAPNARGGLFGLYMDITDMVATFRLLLLVKRRSER
ncbi:hypothetical protein [Nonomuraea dietziae]|uniref:hypothetical protein n=1 Tax=Nonomuraea dietziae TaxID=65515 RepID=UPI00341ED3F9